MQTIVSFVPLLVIFGLMYALLIRPQRVQMQRLRAFLDSLRVGDAVVAGGLIGTVRALRGPEVEVEVAPGVVVRVLRGALRPYDRGEDEGNEGNEGEDR
ncbi:MAG: preprotein translocase subunit YajC [Acidimicrobiia bacterium]